MWVQKNFQYSLTHQCFGVLLGLGSEPSNVFNDRGKVGWPPELHCPQSIVIGLHHSLDACTVRVGGMTIQEKLVRHLTSNITTKTKSWKQLVTVGEKTVVIDSHILCVA